MPPAKISGQIARPAGAPGESFTTGLHAHLVRGYLAVPGLAGTVGPLCNSCKGKDCTRKAWGESFRGPG
jgi:hypothetical protein